MSVINRNSLTAVSLFCSAGIGDLALEAVGAKVLVANELLPERAELFQHNFPDTTTLVGDVWSLQDNIISETRHLLAGRPLDLLFATPPCQGMSKNGRGKLLNAIRKGEKPKHDERNRLVIPCMNIAVALQPRLVVLENVPEMENTVLMKNGNPEDVIYILDYIADRLGSAYEGSWEVVEFADYGVPQRRQRLITVFTQDAFVKKYLNKFKTALPPKTHSKFEKNGRSGWKTVRDTIASLPPLDAGNRENNQNAEIPFHRVPLLDADKYFWVFNTPPEKGAFDNQCVNPDCLHQRNPTHSSVRGEDGINRACQDTPLHCIKCGKALPRPWVRTRNELRLMKGYTSAYKRMSWDLPASTLTRNLSYACSDNKLHPEQHRVLSLHEAMLLHTVTDFQYEWKRSDGKKVSDKLIREAVGESIPPIGLKVIFAHLLRLIECDPGVLTECNAPADQLSLL